MRRRGRPPYPGIFTPRESEVFDLLRQGFSNPQIADRLGISRAGVKYHVSEILSKLGVSTREEAAAFDPVRPSWLLLPASIFGRLSGSSLAKPASVVVLSAVGVGLMALALGVAVMQFRPESKPPSALIQTTPAEPTAAPAAKQVSISPNVGPCQDFAVSGTGFDPAQEVVVLQWVGLTESQEVQSLTVSASGEWQAQVPAGALENCTPGSEHVFEVRTAQASDENARIVYKVEQLGPLTVTPASAPCDNQSVTLKGGGFPPGATVNILLGQDDPFAHNFGQLGSTVADANGGISFEVALGSTSPCQRQTIGLRAVVDGLDAVWKTAYRVEP